MSHNTKDSFDVWLGLVVDCVAKPLVDAFRATVRALRASGAAGTLRHRHRSRRKRRCHREG